MFVRVIVVSAIIFGYSFYLISFGFLGLNGVWSDISSEQSHIVQRTNFQLVSVYKDYFNSNGSGFNDKTGNKIDDNENDDNYSCYDNYGKFKDDDCFYKGIYGFIPPETKIYLGDFEVSEFDGFSIDLTGSVEEAVFSYKTETNKHSYRKKISNSGYVEYFSESNSFEVFLNNKNKNRLQYHILLSGEDSLKNITKEQGYQKIKEIRNYYKDSFSSEEKIYNTTGFYERPVNPNNLEVYSGDFNGNGTASDISVNWVRTGGLSYTGSLNFKILSGTTLDLTGGVLTGDFSDFCSNDLSCNRTGYNFSTGEYYFKAESYRCLNEGCRRTLENVFGSYIGNVEISF